MSTLRIAALGGGFSLGDPVLDDWLQGLVGKDQPRVTFVGTASGENDQYFRRFVDAWSKRGAFTSRVSLFERDGSSLADHVAAQDIIYVGGGSVVNMAALWRLHGLDQAITAAYHNGTVLAGISAGVNIWFEACTTDSFGPVQTSTCGLGLLAGSVCPHYNTESHRRPHYQQVIAAGELPAGYAVDDGAGILFEDGQVAEVVSVDGSGQVYHVSSGTDGTAVETTLPARRLLAR